jgi:hypothetical protein
MAAIFETEIFDLEPTAINRARSKAKKPAKGKKSQRAEDLQEKGADVLRIAPQVDG